MHFFVARVNLDQQAKLGQTFLRPIQIAYESPKFMLPIRLGMLNADGDQELTVWTVTKKGRVESTNYRTVTLPPSPGMLPEYVKNDFEGVYRAMFKNLERREGNDVIFAEYAGTGAQNQFASIPAPGLATDTLQKLGVWWAGSEPAFITRLHFTYDQEHFPEDLVLQTTSNQAPLQPVFQVQDDVRTSSCLSGEQLRQNLAPQHEQQAQMLARLTGWDASEIREKIEAGPKSKPTPAETEKPTEPKPKTKAWYQDLWK